ncbi:MAG: adenylate/guanylate cyclase domain-containing protein [Cyanobacteria bacterium P01_G01_bin.19]
MWAKLKLLLWQGRGVWITTPCITALVILLRWFGLLQSWEWAVFDRYMRSRPQENPDERIVIVGINEADLQELGTAIIPDGVYARLIEKLKAHQPRAIGLDIYRDLPIEPGHQELIRVFESTPHLVGIQKVAGEQGRQAVAPPPMLKEKGQVGANDLIFDSDNKIRRSLIYLSANGETVYSFSLHLALHYLKHQNIVPQIIEEGDSDRWKLGDAVFIPFAANDGGYVRADTGGYQILSNYRGSSRHFDTVSLMDVLEDRISSDWGRGRIILIGSVAESSNDLFYTPYSGGLFDIPQPIPGVEIHAQFTSQIISAALDNRPLFKNWSELAEWSWIFLWSGIGATLRWQFRYRGGRQILSWYGWIGLLISGVTLVGSTYIAFLEGWWIPVVPAFLGLGGSVAAITAYVARTAEEIRKTFGRYLTDQVVANLLENPEGLKLGGERRKITILTSDLRGFTATSERLLPEDVIKLLNIYLCHMADVITEYQGTIDEFQGDGILVLFGAPTLKDDDVLRAIACACAMQLKMVEVNQEMKQMGLPQLEMGIGINTGEVVVGNIGSEKRSKYGVVGSQVNLTYRIESYTLGGQILISERTFQDSQSIVIAQENKKVLPKGAKNPITIYQVTGIEGKYNLLLPQEEEIFITLVESIPIQYSILEGKDVSDRLFAGRIVQLSANEALVCSENQEQQGIPSGLSNIKLNLLSPNKQAKSSEDVYAKVIDKPAKLNNFYVHFTAKPPKVAAKLNSLYKFSKRSTSANIS